MFADAVPLLALAALDLADCAAMVARDVLPDRLCRRPFAFGAIGLAGLPGAMSQMRGNDIRRVGRIVTAHVVRGEGPQIMRRHADRGLRQLGRKVAIRLAVIERQPVSPDEFLIADVDQPIGTAVENPLVQDVADLGPDRARFRLAPVFSCSHSARQVPSISRTSCSPNRHDTRSPLRGGLLRMTAQTTACCMQRRRAADVCRQIMGARPELPDPVGDMRIASPLHQAGQPLMLVLLRQRGLVSKIAQ